MLAGSLRVRSGGGAERSSGGHDAAGGEKQAADAAAVCPQREGERQAAGASADPAGASSKHSTHGSSVSVLSRVLITRFSFSGRQTGLGGDSAQSHGRGAEELGRGESGPPQPTGQS